MGFLTRELGVFAFRAGVSTTAAHAYTSLSATVPERGLPGLLSFLANSPRDQGRRAAGCAPGSVADESLP